MTYKINIHAHSIFSDGSGSPIEMAREAKRLGFSALVLTDHFYNGTHPEVALVESKMTTYKKAIKEANTILPTIRGMEIPFGGEEVLVFGTKAIDHIIECNGITDNLKLEKIRNDFNCAIVLCHPVGYYDDFIHLIDGYERHNSGDDYFKNGRELRGLKNLQAWHNSDAHHVSSLNISYNIVDVNITNEQQLIKYIKSGKQHDYHLEDCNPTWTRPIVR